MINIVYTILLFNILIIVFKMFKKYKVDNLQGLIVNYLTAAICSYFFLEQDFLLDDILQSDWIYHAIIIGSLFIIVFNFYAFGIQKVGIAVTTVANKMSLIIPVCAALILYPNEEFTSLKGIAFILALVGIYLSSTKSGKLSFDKKYLWLIILVFVGQGISDAIFNDFAQSFKEVLEKESYLFFMTLFIIASISGILILSGKSFKGRNPLKLKSVFWGVIFGIPNFFSLVFFLKALNDPELSSSIVFPLVSMGVIVSSSIIGMILFKEKLSKNNWIGILLSICAIYIFSI
ncbi:MAG: DMT family transporter [Flavobacteriales bacterium]|mgnify:CR=1 FL=1|jgi:drug/metabolite transporter (DMT)-like permease|nr:DMT family transporter [Flavobacteriales bacterium]MBT5354781.1 DMT family transporter [Flavobacteriales bacterium]MBT5699608.1 DMT family transporter [Flavobacteriales bacterium]MBT7620084.1 DMT family transporter [Flavobacteriales bacterium]MBT7725913.1 DMT family transporter [Flavobacteriales bacterium]